MKHTFTLAILVAVSLAPMALAEETPPPVRASEYPRSDGGPAIIIRHQQDTTYYEYRVNGELQEIRVEPEIGPAYYLIPVAGGFQRREESLLLLPSWVLFRW